MTFERSQGATLSLVIDRIQAAALEQPASYPPLAEASAPQL